MEEMIVSTKEVDWGNIVCDNVNISMGITGLYDGIKYSLCEKAEIPHLKKYVKKDDLNRLMWKRGGRF